MKEKITCERLIFDFRGMPINPGNVVAISRSGRHSGDLEAYIVTGISESNLRLAEVKSAYRKDSDGKYAFVTKPSVFGSRRKLHIQPLQSQVVVIENPLFSLENPQMKNIISMADFLRGKFFPNDYKVGESVLTFQEP